MDAIIIGLQSTVLCGKGLESCSNLQQTFSNKTVLLRKHSPNPSNDTFLMNCLQFCKI